MKNFKRQVNTSEPLDTLRLNPNEQRNNNILAKEQRELLKRTYLSSIYFDSFYLKSVDYIKR